MPRDIALHSPGPRARVTLAPMACLMAGLFAAGASAQTAQPDGPWQSYGTEDG